MAAICCSASAKAASPEFLCRCHGDPLKLPITASARSCRYLGQSSPGGNGNAREATSCDAVPADCIDRHHFTRADYGTLGTAHITPPLPSVLTSGRSVVGTG